MLKKLEYISPRQFKEFQKLDALQHEKVIFGSSDSSDRLRKKRQNFVSGRFKSLVLDAYRMKKITAEEAASKLRVDKNRLSSLLK